MKIGILTYHSVFNFGANLQVFSTVGYLKNNGFDPIIINWLPEDLETRYNKSIPLVQANCHKKFLKTHIPCTELCRTEIDIIKVIKNHNIKKIIVGSDAVLQHSQWMSRLYLRRKGIVFQQKPGSDVLFPNPFWGSFNSLLDEKIPVAIMSASSQNTNYKYIRGRLRKKICSALGQFESITVRDTWTQKMIKYLTYNTVNPSITPDPVFAYNQNISKQYSKKGILKKFNLPERYLLFSFRSHDRVSKEWLESFQEFAETKSLHCVALPMPNGIKFNHPFSKTIDLPLCPEEWYGLIRYSSGYIGENMHPIVVALHNEVPFYAFDSYGIVRYKFFVNEESSKIHDILSLAGFLDKKINILSKAYKCPEAEEVFNQLINFDDLKCNKFRTHQQESYNNMMNNILSN